MKILLDTHTALWWVNDYEKLPMTARELILDEANTLYISVVSMWEVAIKASIGKLLEFNGGAGAFIAKVDLLPVHLVTIAPRHAGTVENLPFIHRDPFDRMLIAIAKTDNMTILTADENIHKYDVSSMW